jgi:hypothetical protein
MTWVNIYNYFKAKYDTNRRIDQRHGLPTISFVTLFSFFSLTSLIDTKWDINSAIQSINRHKIKTIKQAILASNFYQYFSSTMRQQFIITLLLAIIFWAKSDDSTEAPNLNAEILRPICPLIRCILQNCDNGYIVNQAGCTTCECNPCKFGQPLFKFPCGQGQNQYRWVNQVINVWCYSGDVFRNDVET